MNISSRQLRIVYRALVAAVLILGVTPAIAQQSVWQIWNHYGSCQYGSTYNCCPPVEEPAWGPSGWTGTVWWGWDCETSISSSQYCYVSCDSAPVGYGLLGRHWFIVYQASTFEVVLNASSSNAFTRVTAALRSPADVPMVTLTAEPTSSPAPLQVVVTLSPGVYELRVDSPAIAGGGRAGLCTARVNFVSTDGDGDGIPDALDGCPMDPNKSAPGTCGCGVADSDQDHDGALDCIDGCPLDASKSAPGQCGCGIADQDTDSDGAADCVDLCPFDPAKVSPQQCGCGLAETDADADGHADCIDNCPALPNSDQLDCDSNGIGDVCEIAAGEQDINSNSIPDSCECLADLFADGLVNGADLGILLNQWGLGKGAVSDINRDGTVNAADLSILLNSWGACP